VNRQQTTSDNQDSPENDLEEMSCENHSTSSLHSDHSQHNESEDPDPLSDAWSYNSGLDEHPQLDDSEDADSLYEDDSDAWSHNSGLDSVEDDISYTSGDESQDCVGQVVRVFLLLKNVPD
jgi:hypothetical protein